MTRTQSIDFSALELLLSGANASWEAAEAHGAFCGRACLAGASSIRTWLADVLPASDAADALAAERAGKLEALAVATLLELEAGDLRFQLMLPDDDEPLRTRTAALVDWCHGFMHGLVAAGGADMGPRGDALDSDVVTEILDDFNEILKAGVTENSSNEDENAFAELVEFVRVSTQLVYDETASLRDGGRA